MNQQLDTSEVNISCNFNTLKMKDSRLLDRFHKVVRSIQRMPEKSFPSVFPSKSELDGFYRLMNNSRVEFSNIMNSTYDSTLSSCVERELVLAIHDTTQFLFPGNEPIEGLGRLNQKKGERGFFSHFCIASTLKREVLGILGLKPWVRPRELRKERLRPKNRSDRSNEKQRWLEMIFEVHSKTQSNVNVVHLADRDADDYATFAPLVAAKIRFVIRAQHNRILQDQKHKKLFDSLRNSSVIAEKEVPISGRKSNPCPRSNKAHPARKTRTAKLAISAKPVEILRGSKMNKELPSKVILNFVRVFELDAPEGETPIEWILITTEPILNIEDINNIVNMYSCRWTVEEFFKALKTGCEFQKRKFESLHAILNCLAILAPVACKLYNLKILGREHAESPATNTATHTQIRILAKLTKESEQNLQTVGAIMWAVAALGGHLKHNGLPGWQVLARGYERLLQLERGWMLATQFNSEPALPHRNM